jgi:hypothetical protein
MGAFIESAVAGHIQQRIRMQNEQAIRVLGTGDSVMILRE